MSFKSSSMRLKYRNIIQIFTTFALLPPLTAPHGWDAGPLSWFRPSDDVDPSWPPELHRSFGWSWLCRWWNSADSIDCTSYTLWSEFCRKLLCVEFGFCVRGGLARPQLSRELSKRLDLRRRWLFNIYVVFPHSADCQNSNIATSLALVPLVQ